MTEIHQPAYPGYDVLLKRNSPSWNDETRRVIDKRLAVDRGPNFLSVSEYAVLEAVAARIVPQDHAHPFVPLAAYVDAKLAAGSGPGYRNAKLPKAGEAWKRALAALEAVAQADYGSPFVRCNAAQQDALLTRMQKGELQAEALGDMPPALFFAQHVLTDIVQAYYAHPSSWSQIGFGGPASPRGYVRMDFDRRDPWEASEAHPGREEKAYRENRHV